MKAMFCQLRVQKMDMVNEEQTVGELDPDAH